MISKVINFVVNCFLTLWLTVSILVLLVVIGAKMELMTKPIKEEPVKTIEKNYPIGTFEYEHKRTE